MPGMSAGFALALSPGGCARQNLVQLSKSELETTGVNTSKYCRDGS
jgi:hypothetical protein